MLTLEQRTRLGVSELIFEGSNSEVYRTRARPGRGPAILKVLKADAPQAREKVRFHQESVIAERVLSPYVARVYRPVQDPVALVVEDIGGRSLAQLLVEAPPDLGEALRIAIGIARGLGSIHAAHVAHKDISPSNIIWNRETEQLRIIDFGIASLLDSDLVQPEAPRNLEGNLPYMSPEQTGRMNLTIDYRTDLYSFGVTLFELFTGRLPFQSADPLELLYFHVARPPPDPRSIRPELPVAIDAILTRLLAKSAEDRYPSAEGVEADLVEVLRRLSAPGEDAPFELGKQDRAIRFLIPSKLYGRQEETAQLTASFERVRSGRTVLTLVSGYAGVGKTALVHELYRPLAAARGRYTSGKFDQYQRNVPYSAIAATFNALCGQIVAEGPALRQAWSERLLSRLGPSAGVLSEGIPRLAEVIGPQPPAPTVDPEAARNRFNEAFCNFLEAAARPEEPLVVFLDDLQWADLTSLQLLKQVLLTGRQAGLHLVGAFRENEVEASHPLALMLEEVRRAGRAIESIHLDNLRPTDVTDLVADAVRRGPAEAAPLAEAIYAKTKGNAFFTIAFLRGLADDRLFSYDHRRWTWDLDRIASRNITENVVDFMARRIQLFGAETQAALTMAACVGNSFELTTLGVLLHPGSGLPEVLDDLTPALAAGVIVATTPAYKKVGIVDVDGTEVRFRFQHDRVQQAAYSLIPEAARPEVHHRIGRLLHLHALSTGTLAARLFEIVGHLNQGCVVDARERLEVARGRTKTSFGHVLRAAGMQELVKDLLSLSRLGRVELKPSPVNVSLLVDEVRTLLEDVIVARKACVTYSGVETILAEPGMILQVFTNLVHNGLKFVPADRAPVVTIRGVSTPSSWRIEVEDNGIGFPEHGRERAFHLFQRLHTDPAFEGTGLGLAICKKVVELHGGTIALADPEGGGGGARVEFTLPSEATRRFE